MNRLWVRLALAFVAVTLVAVVAIAVLADLSAANEFRQYLARQDSIAQTGLLNDLAAYYQRNGNWNGVESVLATFDAPIGGGRGQSGQGRGRPPLMLADASGGVVYDERKTRVGSLLSADERGLAQTVVVNGNTVGYLVLGQSGRGSLAPAEQNFLDALRVAFVLAALIAGVLGIVLGILVSRAIALPLANLAQAARAFGARDWSKRVQVEGTDEIAQVAREFNQMADEIQRAERLRRNLMADIAHELRTPLTVLQGNLSAMLDEVYPLDRAEIATLYDETRLLSRLVDDLRELALADAGQLRLNLQPTHVGAIIESTVANLRIGADAQGVRMNVEPNANLPHVNADPDRVAQILRNLLTNALRHTPSGGSITVTGAFAPNGYVRVSVLDTGEGIASEDLPHVFSRFYRGSGVSSPGTRESKPDLASPGEDASGLRSRTSGSTGLGLAIVKAWVEAMHGQVGMESERGRGSQFWFTLPIARE